MSFVTAYKKLSSAEQASLDNALQKLSKHPSIEYPTVKDAWQQVVQNFRAELHLNQDTVLEIMKELITTFTNGLALNEAYTFICHQKSLKGPLASLLPTDLKARVMTEEAFFDYIIEHKGESAGDKIELLMWLEDLDLNDVVAVLDEIKDYPLGRYVQWSTFNEVDKLSDPFATWTNLSRDHIHAIFALHPDDLGKPMLVFVYDTPLNTHLHIPTIADAADGPFFRPPVAAAAQWGYTNPHDAKLAPQAEVVHTPINGSHLKKPLRRV